MKCLVCSFLAVLQAVAMLRAAEPPVIGGLGRAGTEPLAGAVLVSELACAACHASNQAAFAPKAGPDLSAVGARVNGARQFIAQPSSVKPGTTMPDVLAHLPDVQREDAAMR